MMNVYLSGRRCQFVDHLTLLPDFIIKKIEWKEPYFKITDDTKVITTVILIMHFYNSWSFTFKIFYDIDYLTLKIYYIISGREKNIVSTPHKLYTNFMNDPDESTKKSLFITMMMDVNNEIKAGVQKIITGAKV